MRLFPGPKSRIRQEPSVVCERPAIRIVDVGQPNISSNFSYTQQGFTAPTECVHREGCKNEKR